MRPVEPIQNLDALIDLFSDPPAFAARLADWRAVRDEINQKLGMVQTVDDADTLQAQADAARAEATAFRTQATEALAEARTEAERVVKEATATAQGIVASANELADLLDMKRRALDEQDKDVKFRERQLRADLATLAEDQTQTGALRREATQLKTELERRLLAIKEAAA